MANHRRIKFFLTHNWRRIIFLGIIILTIIILAKHIPEAQPVFEALVKIKDSHSNKDVGFTSVGDNSHYFLPDEAVGNIDQSLQPIPDKFIGLEKCPACFGLELCDEIKNGFVRVSFPDSPNIASQRGFYYGKWHKKQVVVRKIGEANGSYEKFEKYICENVTQSKNCDISEMIVKSFAAKTSSFTRESLQGAYGISHKEPHDLPYTICMTQAFIDEVKEAYGLDGEWTMDKAAMLYSSMVINPEVVLLKSITMFTNPWPFPRLMGSCGQLIVLEHSGLPLESYTNAPWPKRAELAQQLLNMVDFFANGDVSWYLMYGDFQPESFDVNNEGHVVVVNLEHLSVIDKEAMTDYEDNADNEEPCNENCFHNFVKDFMNVKGETHARTCARVPRVMTDAMYAMLCKNILSDQLDHRDSDTEEADQRDNLQPRGLLHTPPDQYKQDILGLISECISEAVAGARLQAVEDLGEILQQYTKDTNRQEQNE